MAHGHHDHGHAHAAAGHAAAHHHEHVIVPKRLLITIFGLLLFFTALTVGMAKFEVFAQESLRIDLPGWVNVAIALSIATVKSVIVALYFMQLRYDNPMNGAIAIFTLFVLAFFLGFTMIDLGNRGVLYEYKAVNAVSGGSGSIQIGARDAKGERISIPAKTSIAVYWRDRTEAEIAQARADGKLTNKELPKTLAKYEAHRLDEIRHLTVEGKPLPAHLAAYVTAGEAQYAAMVKDGKPVPAWLADLRAAAQPPELFDSGPMRSRPLEGVTIKRWAPAPSSPASTPAAAAPASGAATASTGG